MEIEFFSRFGGKARKILGMPEGQLKAWRGWPVISDVRARPSAVTVISRALHVHTALIYHRTRPVRRNTAASAGHGSALRSPTGSLVVYGRSRVCVSQQWRPRRRWRRPEDFRVVDRGRVCMRLLFNC